MISSIQKLSVYLIILSFVLIATFSIGIENTKAYSPSDYTCPVWGAESCNPDGPGCGSGGGEYAYVYCPNCELYNGLPDYPIKYNGCYVRTGNMCRDGDIDPVTGLGGLQFCGAGGGCVCVDGLKGNTGCTNSGDACYGEALCCGTASCNNNGVVDPNEECDDGLNGNDVCPSACSKSCKINDCSSNISVNVNPLSKTVEYNSTTYGAYNVTVSNWSYDTGVQVALSLSGCPSGAACSLTSTNFNLCKRDVEGCDADQTSQIWIYNAKPAGTYKLTVTAKAADGGVKSKTVDLIINPPPAPTANLKVNGSDGPVISSYNVPVTLSWNSTNATSCSVNPGGYSGLSNGGTSTGGITTSTTFILSCLNASGLVVTDPVTVNIPPVPTNLQVTCDADGKTVRSTWTLPAGYSQTYFRANKGSSVVYPPDVFQNDSAGTSQNFASTEGQQYTVYIHTKDATGAYSNHVSKSVTCGVPNNAPNAPTVTGPTTGNPGTSYSFSTRATDPDGDTVRYGIDWDPVDATVDAWLPSSGYVASGGSQAFSKSWPSTGAKTFKVLAEDSKGARSGWTTKTVTISAAAPVTADISATDYTPPFNGNTTVNWISTGATSCTVTQTGWTGLSGSKLVTGLVLDKPYTLVCMPGSITDSIFIDVQAAASHILYVTRTGQGAVTSNPSGISCGSDCSQSYNQGTTVTLHAAPAAGRIFTGWGGVCSGTPRTSDCTVTMGSTDMTAIANFAIDPNYKEF